MSARQSDPPQLVLRAAERVPVTVPSMRLTRAIRNAITNYNEQLPFGARAAHMRSGDAFLSRITVNYLRHATRYDNSRNVIRGSAAAEQAGNIIKRRTLAAIAENYPALSQECARQAND